MNTKAIIEAVLGVGCLLYEPLLLAGDFRIIFIIAVRIIGLSMVILAYNMANPKPAPLPPPTVPEKSESDIDAGLDNLKKL